MATMNLKLDIAILLIAAGPVYAQAQNPSTAKVSKGDPQKVATAISSDKVKTQAYCDMQKVADQMEEARKNNNSKTVDELSRKAEVLAKTLGPEYQALIDGLRDVAQDEQLDDEFLSAFHALDSLCAR
jgi:hypothetical protein